MGRTARTPGVPTERLTAYVHPATKHELTSRAETAGVSIGEIVDRIVTEMGRPQIVTTHNQQTSTLTDATWKDHPGWKLNSLGQNVCIHCGGNKTRVKNQSCKGPR